LLGRTTWASGSGSAEGEALAEIAVYRDRFNVPGDGLGPRPEGGEMQLIWSALGGRFVLRRDDDRADDHQLEHDVGLER
jgi:hypothetical protein